MKTTTRRLPKTLKKKLEANLKNLTPREAARLWLIYFREAAKDDFSQPLDKYPPAEELFDAWERRWQEAKKDPEESKRVGRLFNGFAFLTNLVREANRFAMQDAWRVLFFVTSTAEVVKELLIKDWVSEVARFTKSRILDDIPSPASREEYDRLIQWSEGDALIDLEDGELIDRFFVEDWVEAQGFQYIDRVDCAKTSQEERPEELKAIMAQEGDRDEDLRRLYVDIAGDRLLERFGGRREWVEDWVKEEFYFKPDEGLRFTLDEYDAKIEETSAQLVNLVTAGDLEGGQAVRLDRVWDMVLIKGGKIPAWAALRSIWGRWLYDHDHFLREAPVPDPKALNGIQDVYNAEGDVDVVALVNLARAFFEDCKAKPWGEGLGDAGQIGFVTLARFLTEADTPITEYTAPTLGDIDFEVFKANEGDAVLSDPDWVATVRSLKAKAADFGVDPKVFEYDYTRDRYYPTDRAEEIRGTLALTLNLLSNLQVNHRAFTHNRSKGGAMSAQDFLGAEFTTPLEEAVKEFGEAFGMVATFKRVYETIADEFFDGLPLLTEDTITRIQAAEAILADAETSLNEWLTRIETTWGGLLQIDLSSLRLVKTEPDERTVKEYADILIKAARRDLGPNAAIDLGPDDEEPIEIRKASRRKPEPVEVTVDAEGSEEE